MGQASGANYMQTFIGWGFQALSFFITKPEDVSRIGEDSLNLLAGFQVEGENVLGEVEAAKVRDVVQEAMKPITSFWRAGFALTAVLFFSSRAISSVPIFPTALMGFSIAFALITWDIGVVKSQMSHVHTEFHRIVLNSSEHEAKVGFKKLVRIIDSYSKEIIAKTWLISVSQTVVDSFTNWEPHLREQVFNVNQPPAERKQNPWDIVATYFPILPMITRVAAAANNSTAAAADSSAAAAG